MVVEPFRNHTRPDSPRNSLYTQRYSHSPRHHRINKRHVPAPTHQRRSSQYHLNIVTSPDSLPQHSTNNNESAEHPRSRRTCNQATRNLNSMTPVLTTLTPNIYPTPGVTHPSGAPLSEFPQQGVTPNWAHPQQGVTPNWAYPAMLNLFAQMFNAFMLYNQQRPIARAMIPEQTQYEHNPVSLPCAYANSLDACTPHLET